MRLEKGKKGWCGPLAGPMEGIAKERIAVEANCSVTTVINYMTDPGKQRTAGIDFLAALHRLASPKGKAEIEKFISDQLVA